jgi:hypothetical protein
MLGQIWIGLESVEINAEPKTTKPREGQHDIPDTKRKKTDFYFFLKTNFRLRQT